MKEFLLEWPRNAGRPRCPSDKIEINWFSKEILGNVIKVHMETVMIGRYCMLDIWLLLVFNQSIATHRIRDETTTLKYKQMVD